MCWQQQILEQTSRRLKQPTTAAVVLGLPRFAISEQAELAELQKNAKIRCDVKMQRDGVKMKRYGFLCTFWGLTLSQICCWCLPETVSKTWCDGVKDVVTSRNTYCNWNITSLQLRRTRGRAEPKASLSRTIERVSLLLYPVNGFKSKIFVQEYKRSPIPLDELHCNEI